jgi:HCOMODA/2-hydroxy-3-carboxy-muconic semialdehyde decarboxylase
MSNNSPYATDVPADLLADLAAASRILAAQGVVDGFGHVSVRNPANPTTFLMSRSLAPALVSPEDIVEYGPDGEAIQAGSPGGFLERFIHSEIYLARPDICSVVHSHSTSVIPYGLGKVPVHAMFHNAAFLACGVPTFDIRDEFGATDLLISERAKGKALADTLGATNVVLLRAHGSVACGPTLPIAVFRAVYTEVNARIQTTTLGLMPLDEVAFLDEEEGRLADVPNQTAGIRAWHLWRTTIRNQTGW